MTEGVNKERIKLWVDALRSGKYAQTKNTLVAFDYDDDTPIPVGYCCLGVACDVADKNATSEEAVGWEYWANELDLPHAVARWYGLDKVAESDDELSSPVLTNDACSWSEGKPWQTYDKTTATIANDSLNWDFDRIADAIEARYLAPATDAAVSGE